ncbi:MAG TPA: carbon-nitrogen hydrolase family protein [Aggregatilineales bacterium]|nr:carbon-nitrogen hydrolase family protein [Anaerolineales bacterium]HRE48149.1 carbon-nitrogen hydrolase family protein [Aggregatilineales bacterium]
MSRYLRAAAVQMDATPAPLEARLARAADLVAEAAGAGAQIVALPEFFNTGYLYDDSNYARAERIDGRTATWLRAQAKQHAIHLTGTLLLLDEEDTYNTALLVAPDGRMWRYDKQYPFLWERKYYRENRHITVADTDLGKIGLMICWDAAHPDLWARYAGRVDAMLILSCPPKVSAADLVFPDGSRVNTRDLGGIWRLLHTEIEHFPGADMDDHAAWLGVPVIHASAGGQFRSPLPISSVSIAAYLSARPDLWKWLPRAHEVVIEAGFDLQTKVIDHTGNVVARVMANGDGLTYASLPLAESPPEPTEKQPAMRTSPLAYFLSDAWSNLLLVPEYRMGVRRHINRRMAPIDPRTRVWVGAAATLAAMGLLAGRALRRGGSDPSRDEAGDPFILNGGEDADETGIDGNPA